LPDGVWHAVSAENALAEGQAAAIAVAGERVLLVRSDNAWFCVEGRCSHADMELVRGVVRNGWIACPAHGARFDLATGEPLNPPACAPIATYPVRVNDGLIEVCLAANG
jgi:nitrite reductase/ring-hydroxylating ferredoxin subunit